MKDIRKYSPKENLALIINASKNIKYNEINKYIELLKQLLNQNKSKEELFKNISENLLDQISNYWEMDETQVLAYGYIVFNHFKISNEEITPENITKSFIYYMKLYSPNNAVDMVEKNLTQNL